MGGAAFPSIDGLSRIFREHLEPTLHYVADALAIKGLTYEYVHANLVGSVGKQPSSGDIDIAVDARLFPRDVLSEIYKHSLARNGAGTVIFRNEDVDHLVMTAWPIVVDYYGGVPVFLHGKDGHELYVQVDFSYGNADWLKYSHWSPGKYHSAYPGVMIQTLMMLLVKMNKEFVWTDEHGLLADVGLIVDVNRGMYRLWRLRKRTGDEPSRVDPDFWESNFRPDGREPPRFARIGYINDPTEVVRLTLGAGVTPADIDTFEKLWAIVVDRSAKGELPPVAQIKSRMLESLIKLPMKTEFTRDQMESFPVWADVKV
jgi:hypothetical protein